MLSQMPRNVPGAIFDGGGAGEGGQYRGTRVSTGYADDDAARQRLSRTLELSLGNSSGGRLVVKSPMALVTYTTVLSCWHVMQRVSLRMKRMRITHLEQASLWQQGP